MLRNAQELFRSEIRLAKTEIREEATRAASSVLWLVASCVIVLSSWSFLLWTAAYALSAVMAMWAATLVIALTTATVGAISIGVGVRRMKRVAPVPERTPAARARDPECPGAGIRRTWGLCSGNLEDPSMGEMPLHRLYYHYSELPWSQRVLFTAALIVLGFGYLFALIYMFHSHAGRDGNPNMLSYEDLVIAYSGSGKHSRLESALRGPMSTLLGSLIWPDSMPEGIGTSGMP